MVMWIMPPPLANLPPDSLLASKSPDMPPFKSAALPIAHQVAIAQDMAGAQPAAQNLATVLPAAQEGEGTW